MYIIYIYINLYLIEGYLVESCRNVPVALQRRRREFRYERLHLRDRPRAVVRALGDAPIKQNRECNRKFIRIISERSCWVGDCGLRECFGDPISELILYIYIHIYIFYMYTYIHVCIVCVYACSINAARLGDRHETDQFIRLLLSCPFVNPRGRRTLSFFFLCRRSTW